MDHKQTFGTKPSHKKIWYEPGDEPEGYVCPVCGQTFTREGAMLRHERTHQREHFGAPKVQPEYRLRRRWNEHINKNPDRSRYAQKEHE